MFDHIAAATAVSATCVVLTGCPVDPELDRTKVSPCPGGSAVAWVEEDLRSVAPAPGHVLLRFFDSAHNLQPPLFLGEATPRSAVADGHAART